MTIDSLAAFDPAKLAMMLANQPSDARVVCLMPTGPVIAREKGNGEIMGALVYEDDKVYVYCGGETYEQVAQLSEFDGKPYLCWMSQKHRAS